ncbi:beta-ketoacyl synthase N-terminal-like domain-containing protein [Streptomyces sp. NPDC046909]|uniref:type I polyketide synthase n=1 Tax=Streptomyces sp. NPDC046909 TaxID=3155617 RepID=UPI0033D19643
MSAIAVTGMAGRLPGAPTLTAFWDNLLAGRDCVTRSTPEELRGLVPDELLDDPRWIGASGRIDGVYDFDAPFFGMAPKDALVTDPQHRLLLTTVHQALEDASVLPGGDPVVGVFAGVGRGRHEEIVRGVFAARGEEPDEVALEMGNEKDHSSTKVAFRLGLTGPAMTLQTACSTGLLAVHQASRSLAGHECDVAVAAAAAVRVPDVHGYRYLAGGIGSPDGVCRPFSARAGGAVAGDGVVAVVLKRLEDALADGDRIYAVVRGSAVNNDGAKSGYASVSADAQERLMRDALLFAEAEADTIGSIESHGSGTALGDATEWAALSAVYGKGPGAEVGSVKSGIGHLREASGLAGFVRAVLSVRHGRIPPTLHVGLPADFVQNSDSTLRLARTAREWRQDAPRRAAVSALGLGGTNVHAIVEEPPPVAPRGAGAVDRPRVSLGAGAGAGAGAHADPHAGIGAHADVVEQPPVAPQPPAGPRPRPHLLLLSAHTAPAADRTAEAWRDALAAGEVPPDVAADVSLAGRRHRRHRRTAVGHDAAELCRELDAAVARNRTIPAEPGRTDICFVLPGVGDHYQGMGAGLGTVLPGFAELLDGHLERCSDLVGHDLKGLVRPASGATGGTAVDLQRLLGRARPGGGGVFDPVASHAVLFSLQLSLARSLQRLGVHPDAVTGHSLGELTAATLAGVFTDEAVLRVVVERARLVAEQPEGAMIALSLSEDEARELTGPGVWLATVNSSRSCVLAGERDRIHEVADKLTERGLQGRLLPIRHALHTPLLQEAGERLADLLTEVGPAAPTVPLVANLTGGWAGEELTDVHYWSRQLTSPVMFGKALRTASTRCGILLEIGPGQLRTLAAQSRAHLGDVTVIPTMRREYQGDADDVVLTRALGQLWQAGYEPDRAALGTTARSAPAAGLPPTAMDPRHTCIAEGLTAQPVPVAPVTAMTPAAAEAAAPVRTPSAPTAVTENPVGGRDDELRTVLGRVWTSVLGTERIRPDDDFFELGGDSVMSVQLILGIERELGVHVPAIAVFEESTLAGMAERIKDWQQQNPGGHQ